MDYVYPVDVADLVRRAKYRGPEYVRRAGLRDGMREDEQLRAITDSVTRAWFPLTFDRYFHDEIDVGLPRRKWGDNDDYVAAPVFAAAKGDVLCVQSEMPCEGGFEQGRIILGHQTPDGARFYLQYRHLMHIQVHAGMTVKPGTCVGYVGWHADFPHVGVSAVSRLRIGDESTLGPSCRATAIPIGEGAWGMNCVEVDALDPNDWPIDGLSGAHAYFYDPIELIRFCRKEPYRHFIGPGSPHSVAYQSRGEGKELRPNEPVTVKVQLLSYPALRDDPQIQALAQDTNFVIEHVADLTEHAVKAIQDALHATKFSVGRTGPDPEKPGKDGTFGDATQRALAEFQKTYMKPLVEGAKPPSLIANLASKLRTDGALDWLTLHCLDTAARALAPTPAPAPKPAPPPQEAPPPPIQPSTPGPKPELSNTFDATTPPAGTEKLSVHFGIRMYRAFLGDTERKRPSWIWKGEFKKGEADKEKNAKLHDKKYHGDREAGVGYSSCNAGAHYTSYNAESAAPLLSVIQNQLNGDTKIVDGRFKVEWPDLQIDSLRARDKQGNSRTININGTEYPVFRVWNLTWVGSNFTNCCNSQLAALACALADGKDGTKFSVLGGEEFGTARDPSKPKEYCFAGDIKEPKIKVQYPGKDGPVVSSVPVISVFQQTFNTATPYKVKKPGASTYTDSLQNGDLGGHISAVSRFGMGETIFSLKATDQKQAQYKKALIGDLGATGAHAWLLADVRYGIWFAGGQPVNMPPDYAVDQSSFVGDGGDEGNPFAISPRDWKTAQFGEGWGPGTDKTRQKIADLCPPLTQADCDWLIDAKNEATFRSRIATFLAKAPSGPGTTGGTLLGRKVQQISVISWKFLSANLASGSKAEHNGVARSEWHDLQGDGKWVRNDAKTAKNYPESGVTCAWRRAKDVMGSASTNTVALARFYRPK